VSSQTWLHDNPAMDYALEKKRMNSNFSEANGK
jgi:hypothetical protein